MQYTIVEKKPHRTVKTESIDFDGDVANVNIGVQKNGHHSTTHFQLSNADIRNLLKIHPNEHSLDERLANDFLKSTMADKLEQEQEHNHSHSEHVPIIMEIISLPPRRQIKTKRKKNKAKSNKTTKKRSKDVRDITY